VKIGSWFEHDWVKAGRVKACRSQTVPALDAT